MRSLPPRIRIGLRAEARPRPAPLEPGSLFPGAPALTAVLSLSQADGAAAQSPERGTSWSLGRIRPKLRAKERPGERGHRRARRAPPSPRPAIRSCRPCRSSGSFLRGRGRPSARQRRRGWGWGLRSTAAASATSCWAQKSAPLGAELVQARGVPADGTGAQAGGLYCAWPAPGRPGERRPPPAPFLDPPRRQRHLVSYKMTRKKRPSRQGVLLPWEAPLRSSRWPGFRPRAGMVRRTS